MASTRLETQLANDPAFNRMFKRVAKRGNKVSRVWMSIDPSTRANQRKELKALLNNLKKKKASAKSLKNRNLQNALGALGLSADELASEVRLAANDAVKLLKAVPRFAVMRKSEKKKTLKNVINRRKFKSMIVPSIQNQKASMSPHERRCAAVYVLELIAASIIYIVAIIIDVIAEIISLGTLTLGVVVKYVVETVLYILAYAVASILYVDCYTPSEAG